MSKRNPVKLADSNVLSDSVKVANEAIAAAIESVGASAKCAETFDSIARKWAFVDGRKCKTAAAIKKHASDVGLPVAAVREVLRWGKEIVDQYVTKYKATMGEERAKAGAYAFLLNIKRHSAAFIEADKTGQRAAKAKGKARTAIKAKAKGKAKPQPKGPDVAALVAANPQEARKVISILVAALTEAINKRKAGRMGSIRLQTAVKQLEAADLALSMDGAK